MAKQVINLGTSPNKGDGDPLRNAFDKVNDNFDELYNDIKQVKSAQTGGGTLIVDTIGSVHATDSTLLVDGNNSKITGPIGSTTWDVTDQNIDITTTNTGVNANITLNAQGVITLQESTAEDYVQVSSNGVVLYSNSDIALRTQGQDIHIGYDTQSGNVEIGHNSSQTNINGTLNVNAFAKLVPPSYTTAGRSGFTTEGFIVVNTTLGHVEAYVNGAWRKMTLQDVGELTDVGGVIPTDLSNLTDTTNLIKTDVSQLNDSTNIIPTSIGDLLAGGNTSDVLTKSAVGYAWTAPNYFGGAFADLTATPTTLAGYGITDAVALTGLSVSTASAGTSALTYNNLTGAFTFTPPDLSSYLTSVPAQTFASITGKPTTLAGYGITDAATLSNMAPTGAVDFTGASSIDFDTVTINNLDFSDISGKPTTIAGYGITDAFDGNYGSLSGTPSTFTPASHTQAFSTITSTPTTLAGYGITDGLALTGLSVTTASAGSAALSYDNSTGAFTFTPPDLSSYLTTVPAQSFASLTGVPTTLAGYGITDALTSGGNITLGGDLDVGGNSIVSASNGPINIAPNGTGDIVMSGQVKFDEGSAEKFTTTNGATGVTALDCSTGHVHYLTAPAGDITANFTNLDLTAEYGTNVTIIIDQGNTQYEVTAVQIGGAAQTIVWQGNSAPTGTANGVDSFSFTILNDGGTYVVLGQMVAFGGV